MPFEKSVQTESKALKCRSSLRQNWKYKCPPEQYYNIRETSLEDVFTDQVCLKERIKQTKLLLLTKSVTCCRIRGQVWPRLPSLLFLLTSLSALPHNQDVWHRLRVWCHRKTYVSHIFLPFDFPLWRSLSPRVSPSRAPVFSCAQSFKRLLRRLFMTLR